MRRLIKKWFPQSTHRDREKLEFGVIIFLAVILASAIFLVAVFLYFSRYHEMSTNLTR